MILTAADFRKHAREALKGRWMKAGGVALVAGFLGASTFSGSSFLNTVYKTLNDGSGVGAGMETLPEISAAFLAGILGFALVMLIYAIAVFIIGGATTLGYAKYNLNLVDDKDPQLSDVFSQFDRLGTGLLMNILRSLYTFLWSMLFVIPGIIAEYSYSMAAYILYENPGMTANEAITESKMLMRGNKLRLFGLQFSFIGWILLSALCFFPIIMFTAPMVVMGYGGNAVWMIFMFVLVIVYAVVLEFLLKPYIEASCAVFYREIKDRKYSNPEIIVEAEDMPEETEAETVEAEVVDEPEILMKQRD